jgi:acyl CoA:acetate/3-ketoacid CoA transferase beta subunit
LGDFVIPEGEALMRTEQISFRIWTPAQIDQTGNGKTNSTGDFGHLFKLEGSGGAPKKLFLLTGLALGKQ